MTSDVTRIESRMSKIGSYRDLIVWQKAHELALKTYGLCVKFPKADEAFIVKKQLLRSTLSIAANIAKGSAVIKERLIATI